MKFSLILSNIYNTIEHFFYKKEVSSYDILERFNTVRNITTADKQQEMSVRAKLICKILHEYGIFYEIKTVQTEKYKLYNIIVPFIYAESSEVIVHSVHHDVVNVNSLNVLDNTASIANVLALAINLRGKHLKYRTTFVFTDGEEIGFKGAKFIAHEITLKRLGQVKGVIVHELTGSGKMWADDLNNDYIGNKLNEIDADMNFHWTPPNDVDAYKAEKIPTVCLGTMPDDQMAMLKNKGYCSYWNKCHKIDDDMGFAKREDMQNYVNQLKLFSL